MAIWRMCLVLLLMASSPLLQAQQSISKPEQESVIVYTGEPIHVVVPVDGERMIEFRRSIQIGVPRDLMEMKAINVESIAGMVYLRPKVAFEKSRFRFRDMDTGEVFILDISARAGGPSQVLVFSDGRGELAAEEAERSSRHQEAKPASISQLTRFVFQSVYSPERLVKAHGDVKKVAIRNGGVVDMLLPGESVRALPLGQWKTDSGIYATAVQLLNTGSRKVILDPRRLRAAGHWLSAGYITNALNPYGTAGDSVLLVVVGKKPWEDATTWLR